MPVIVFIILCHIWQTYSPKTVQLIKAYLAFLLHCIASRNITANGLPHPFAGVYSNYYSCACIKWGQVLVIFFGNLLQIITLLYSGFLN